MEWKEERIEIKNVGGSSKTCSEGEGSILTLRPYSSCLSEEAFIECVVDQGHML